MCPQSKAGSNNMKSFLNTTLYRFLKRPEEVTPNTEILE